MTHKVISRAEAKKQGLKTFFTGKPCPKGHIDKHLVTGKCVECNRARNKLRPKVGKVKVSKASMEAADRAVSTAIALRDKLLKPDEKDWSYYVTQITAAWKQAVGSIIRTGELLIEAKAEVEHGDWLELVQVLPFGERTAQRLMEIARNRILSDPTHGSDLPPSWRTLYELTKLDDQVLLAKIEDSTIHADMERKEVAALLGPGRQRKRNNKPSPGETYAAMAHEIEDQKAHIAELEAARESGVYIDADDDEATLASKIVKVIGQVRIFALIVELQKQITEEPNNDIPPQTLQ